MAQRKTRAALGAVLSIGLLVLSLGVVSAQTPTAAGATLRGEVVRTGTTPTIDVDGQEVPLTAGPNASIVRGDRTVTLADLKKGDAITVTTNPDGTAARIEAIPVTSDSWFKWWYLLPLLLLPLLLLARRKKKDDFVVEPNRSPVTESGRSTGPR